MIVAVLHPEFLPHLAYWNRMLHADVAIVADTTRFKHRDYQNRCRVCVPEGWAWFSVPIHRAYQQLIRDVRLQPQTKIEMAWSLIPGVYGSTKYWEAYAPALREALRQERLIDVNLTIIRLVREWLGFNNEFLVTSQVTDVMTEDFVTLSMRCANKVGGKSLLAPAANVNVISEDHARQYNLRPLFQRFGVNRYKQVHPVWQARMSILDCLLTHGADFTRRVVERGWSPD